MQRNDENDRVMQRDEVRKSGANDMAERASASHRYMASKTKKGNCPGFFAYRQTHGTTY